MALRTAERPAGIAKNVFNLTGKRREYLAFVLFILPNMLLLAIWTYWPFVYSLYLSLTNWVILRPVKTFVGLDNYVKLLQLPVFWQVMFNTLLFTVITVGLRLAISLALAVLLDQKLLARGVWRLVIFSPHITTSAAMALVWLSMYDPNYGPLAALANLVGLQLPNIIGNTQLALPGLMVVAIWKGLGFSTVIFLAALQGVSHDAKDAAAVDGASFWQSFWHVSFPAISPVTYFLLTTGLIGAFQTFDIVSVMTQGGPANATMLYVYYLYREAFHYYRMGMASTVATVFFFIIMVITVVQTRGSKRWVNY